MDCYNVALGISNQANEWKNDYGEVLQITSKKLLDACVAEMDLFAKELKFDPSNLEDLKFVLNVVTRIADRSMDMELMYLDCSSKKKIFCTIAQETLHIAAFLFVYQILDR